MFVQDAGNGANGIWDKNWRYSLSQSASEFQLCLKKITNNYNNIFKI
jgi:hypothetical protein